MKGGEEKVIDTWSFQSALIFSWSVVWNSILRIIPSILGAILVFVIGLVLSRWMKSLVVNVLKYLKIDRLSLRLKVDSLLEKAELKLNSIELLGILIEWLLILVFFMAAVDILGLRVVTEVITRVISYIPNVLSAVLVIGAGYFLASFVEKLVRAFFVSVNHEIAKPVGRFARSLILVISFFAAIDQLQIAQTVVATFFQGLTYTIVLVVGLAVGLGAKDVVAKILEDWYEKIKK